MLKDTSTFCKFIVKNIWQLNLLEFHELLVQNHLGFEELRPSRFYHLGSAAQRR